MLGVQTGARYVDAIHRETKGQRVTRGCQGQRGKNLRFSASTEGSDRCMAAGISCPQTSRDARDVTCKNGNVIVLVLARGV